MDIVAIICAKCNDPVEIRTQQMGSTIILKVSPCECVEKCVGTEECDHIESAVVEKKTYITVLLNRLNKIRELLNEVR